MNNEYVITFQDGSTTTADILVMAIPCSTYKNITFAESVIPQERVAAIQNIPYGENAKIVAPTVPNYPDTTIFIGKELGVFTFDDATITLYFRGRESYFEQNTAQKIYKEALTLVNSVPGASMLAEQKPALARDDLFVNYDGPSTLYDVPGTMEAACQAGNVTAELVKQSVNVVSLKKNSMAKSMRSLALITVFCVLQSWQAVCSDRLVKLCQPSAFKAKKSAAVQQKEQLFAAAQSGDVTKARALIRNAPDLCRSRTDAKFAEIEEQPFCAAYEAIWLAKDRQENYLKDNLKEAVESYYVAYNARVTPLDVAALCGHMPMVNFLSPYCKKR